MGKSGPEEAAEGVVEGIKGKVKTLVGALVGRDDLFREGQAQQDKAESQRDAAKKEAEADRPGLRRGRPKNVSAGTSQSSSCRDTGEMSA